MIRTVLNQLIIPRLEKRKKKIKQWEIYNFEIFNNYIHIPGLPGRLRFFFDGGGASFVEDKECCV